MPEQIAEARAGAIAKEAKQFCVVTVFDDGELQFQQGVLPGIHVHRMDLLGFVEQIVQCVAPCAGNHHHTAVGAQLQHLAIETRILPTGVVDERTRVDLPKENVVCAIRKCHLESREQQTPEGNASGYGKMAVREAVT